MWRGAVALARCCRVHTLEWVDWYNNRRLGIASGRAGAYQLPPTHSHFWASTKHTCCAVIVLPIRPSALTRAENNSACGFESIIDLKAPSAKSDMTPSGTPASTFSLNVSPNMALACASETGAKSLNSSVSGLSSVSLTACSQREARASAPHAEAPKQATDTKAAFNVLHKCASKVWLRPKAMMKTSV